MIHYLLMFNDHRLSIELYIDRLKGFLMVDHRIILIFDSKYSKYNPDRVLQ